MAFTPSEKTACQKLIDLALAEDLGADGDLTSQAIIPPDLSGEAAFVARADGVIAGLPAAEMVCNAIDAKLSYRAEISDGTKVKRGDRLATITGSMRSLLAAERTALNFLQHLSGVATLTAKYVDAIKGLPAKILDTRKTIPGWRLLDKYAVRCGGGHNHRMGLCDGILIKDNHLAALAGELDIAAAVKKAKEETGGVLLTEVEVDSLDEFREALTARPHIVLLDNMNADELREAVTIRNQAGVGTMLEASGGVTLDTVCAIAESGVDRISIGALTHSAPALDIALDYLS